MKRIVILTGNELRHEFFRKYLAQDWNISVVRTFCGAGEGPLKSALPKDESGQLRAKHLLMRHQTEIDFFQLYCETSDDYSNPRWIERGSINETEYLEEIIALNPDLIISYGCSIIKPPLISAFKGKFINVHLGLSPYYRGSGTNFWPLVNGEPEYVGVSFLHIDGGVDTGEIIHQVQATISYGDNVHQIGNRLIRDMARCCTGLIRNFSQLPEPAKPSGGEIKGKYYRRKDFTEEAVEKLYRNFSEGIIDQYLKDVSEGKRKVQLVRNMTEENNLIIL